MIKDFLIGSYRGLNKVTLQNLSDINILVGINNVGKTSVLEALAFSGLFDDGELLIQTLVSRYQQISVDFIKDMFSDQEKPLICLKRKMKETDDVIHTHITFREQEKRIASKYELSLQKELTLEFAYNIEREEQFEKEVNSSNYIVDFEQEDGNVSIRFGKVRNDNQDEEKKIPCEFISFSRFDRTSYLIESLEKVLEQDKRSELIKVLKLFDQNVENFEVIGKERNIKIFSKDKQQPLSLYDYGNGMYKAFYIASAVLLCENGILLIDEIEAGIHRKALKKFIQYLIEICRQKNIQLFLTTHSLETIDLFIESEENLDRLTAYGLRNAENGTKVRRYSGSKLRELREDMGLDIR